MNAKLASVVSLLVGLLIGLSIGRHRDTAPVSRKPVETAKAEMQTAIDPVVTLSAPIPADDLPDLVESLLSEFQEARGSDAQSAPCLMPWAIRLHFGSPPDS